MIEFGHIDLTLTIADSMGDPSSYIEEFEGKIYASDWPDKEDESDVLEDIEVGSIRIYIIEAARALDDGESLFDVLDSMNSETFDFYESLFDGFEPKKSVKSRINEDRIFLPNLMLISRIELHEKYRGIRIGSEAVCHLIRRLGSSCSIIACKPFPLEYEGWADDVAWAEKRMEPGFEARKDAAWKMVRTFWAKIGFVRVPRSEYFVWPQ